jgi:hypothetical protein
LALWVPKTSRGELSGEIPCLLAVSASIDNGKQFLQLQHGAIRCREDRPASAAAESVATFGKDHKRQIASLNHQNS